MTRAAPLACLLAVAACGGTGVRAPDDAAVPDAPAASVPTTCELVTQDPCTAAEQCNPFCQDQHLVIACRAEPPMPGAVGAACSGPMPCSRGTTCLAVAGKPAACLKLCAVTLDCPMGMGCRDVRVTYACNPAGAEVVTLRACM